MIKGYDDKKDTYILFAKIFSIIAIVTYLMLILLDKSIKIEDKKHKEWLEDEERRKNIIEFNINSAKEYEKSNKEFINIFETYNDNYTNETNKDSRKIFINVSNNSTEVVNDMLNNYVSHVNGEVLSSETRKEYFKKPFFEKQLQTTIRQYTLLVPQGAQYADSLQKIINEYLEYLEQKEYN